MSAVSTGLVAVVGLALSTMLRGGKHAYLRNGALRRQRASLSSFQDDGHPLNSTQNMSSKHTIT